MTNINKFLPSSWPRKYQVLFYMTLPVTGYIWALVMIPVCLMYKSELA